jgi:holo-[acyl-carrier protein] synthase
MVIGVGIDLVEIKRIEEAMKRPRFLERILTPLEREFCVHPHQVAGRWAVKEAIAKALGLPLTWQQVQVLPDELGVPKAHITSEHFDPGRLRVHVSISHEREHAIGMAVLERVVYHAPNL